MRRIMILAMLAFLSDCRVKTVTNDIPLAKAAFAYVLNRNLAKETKEIDVQNFPVQISENTSVSVPVRFTNLLSSGADITVTSSSSSVTVNGGAQAMLRFDPSSSTTPQTISLKTEDDINMVAEKATVTFSSPGYADVVKNVSTVDDDTVNSIIVSRNEMEIRVRWTSQIGVKLMFQPPGDEILTISSSDSSQLIVSGSLRFTASNYNVYQYAEVFCSGSDPSTQTFTLSSSRAKPATVRVYCQPLFWGT